MTYPDGGDAVSGALARLAGLPAGSTLAKQRNDQSLSCRPNLVRAAPAWLVRASGYIGCVRDVYSCGLSSSRRCLIGRFHAQVESRVRAIGEYVGGV